MRALGFLAVLSFIVSILAAFGGAFWALFWLGNALIPGLMTEPLFTLALGALALIAALAYAKHGVRFMGVALKRLLS